MMNEDETSNRTADPPPEHTPPNDETNGTQHTLDAALSMIDKGYAVIPVEYGTKKPLETGWTAKPLTKDEARAVLSERPLNIGVLTGVPSGGIVDVDLDTDEAVRAAHELLPSTRCFGRDSRPYSHWLYRSPGCRSATFVDPSDNKTLNEQRSDGRQTVMPPSIHPSGESVRWENGLNEPTEIDEAVLSKLVADLAAVALIARHWKPGSRHNLALALAGGLLRTGRTRDDVERLIHAIASAAHDDEIADRVATVADADRKLAENAPVTGWPRVSKIVGDAVGTAAMKWFGVKTNSTRAESASGGQAEILLQLCSDAELFHDSQGSAFARFPVDDHFETHPIKSRGAFADDLQLKFEEKQGRPPKREQLESAISLLTARASRGPEFNLATRVATEGDAIVIDLGTDDWRVVKVGPDGWRDTAETSVRFSRSRNLGALPMPVSGGSLNELRPFVNVATDRDFRLLIMFLLASMHPSSTYPVLVLTGEPGTAKTTSCRYCKLLSDPAKLAPLRSMPKTERDIAVAARGSHMPAFTNISHLTKNQSDTICRISTGEGFGIRQLYTDGDEFLFDGARPFILNGIEDFVIRGDLQDRAIQIELAIIPDDKRKPLAELDAAFQEALPRIFGALLDALSAGVREINSTTLAEHPRMADVVRWAVACSAGTPWTGDELLADYIAMQAESATLTVESDDVGHAIIHWARGCTVNEPFIGTATELLTQLNIRTDELIRRHRDWPSNGQRLASILKRLAPSLRKAGVTVERHRSGKQGTKTLTVKCTPLDETSRPAGVGGTMTDPEPCTTCGKPNNLWWHSEHGIWICTCTAHPKDPISATWLKRVTFIPDDPADRRIV